MVDKIDAVKRIVQAGMKVMYSKEGRAMLLAGLDGDKPVPQKLALEVTGLMRILFDKSKKTLPPGAIPAAAALLVYEIADFLRQTGEKVTLDDVKKALVATMDLLRAAFDKEIKSAKGGAPQAQSAPPPAPAPAPMGGGLINQATGA